MIRHLKSLGYVFQYSKLDAQTFLLTQRRNRIYGLADLDEGQDVEQFRDGMKATLSSLSSDIRFPCKDVFDQNLPKTTLQGNAGMKVREAVEKYALQSESSNIFVDTATSSQRSTECAVGVTTCIRPSHPIWSVELSRFVSVEEMFTCQGIFKQDFNCPEAIQRILSDPTQAQDLAGNAFASTCAQAQVIASLVNAKGWSRITGDDVCQLQSMPSSSSQDRETFELDCDVGDSDDEGDSPTCSSSQNTKRKHHIDQFFSRDEERIKRAKLEQAPAAKPFQERGQNVLRLQYCNELYLSCLNVYCSDFPTSVTFQRYDTVLQYSTVQCSTTVQKVTNTIQYCILCWNYVQQCIVQYSTVSIVQCSIISCFLPYH